MAKHTHTGHCQLCDNSQAVHVTKGTIAKHGYTKRWGFFSGTCPGSDHQPYEISVKLLPAEIIRQKDMIASLRKRVAEMQEMASEAPLKGEAICVVNLTNRERVSCERMGTFSNTQGTYHDGSPRNVVVFTPDHKFVFEARHNITAPTTLRSDVPGDRFDSPSNALRGYFTDAAGFAERWRKAKINSLESLIKQHVEYRNWLQTRLEKWELRELTAVVRVTRREFKREDEIRDAGGSLWVLTTPAMDTWGRRQIGWRAYRKNDGPSSRICRFTTQELRKHNP